MKKVKLEMNKAHYVAITTDGWTSVNNDSFYAITAHFIDVNCDIKTILLSTFKFSGQHTSENVKDQFTNVITECNLDGKIVACITDNAANMVKAVQLAQWWHIPCFAHSLNLIVQSSLLEIDSPLANIKSIVEFFKSSSATEKLQNVQKRMGAQILKLKQDCPTRWNSIFDMLYRIQQSKESIQSTLAILNNPSLSSIQPEEWRNVVKYFPFLMN